MLTEAKCKQQYTVNVVLENDHVMSATIVTIHFNIFRYKRTAHIELH